LRFFLLSANLVTVAEMPLSTGIWNPSVATVATPSSACLA
jgi:hypothetical protein